jgi:flavorubredoxin
MTATNADAGTNVSEIAERIYRINTPVPIAEDQQFSFNQYLVDAERPLLFHTGPHRLFAAVRGAVDRILPAQTLRYIAFSHVEADECGSLAEWLAIAPDAVPLCSAAAAMTSVGDITDRPAQALRDGETVDLGGRVVEWIDAPHVPHGWDCGFLFEQNSRTLFCGDLFTQPGPGTEPLINEDILGPSEAFRKSMDYYSHGPNTNAVLERMASTNPKVLACMHGSAWRGDGGALIRSLAAALTA